MSARSHHIVALLASVSLLILAGCAKKPVAAKTVSPPPPAPAPTATLSASPNAVESGQSAKLIWSTQNANEITIAGVGIVAASGSMAITPQSSTTYVLTAKGPGGSNEASARVTVNPPPETAKAQPTDEQLFSQNIQDVFFAYDKASVPSDEESAVQHDAKFLAAHPYIKFVISGHCDERGSEEYNLTLGDSRADVVRDQLERLGVTSDRIRTISYGKEKPFCNQDTEECWQMNRRAHFTLQP
jgi:peptidoglycan-associated lipoprotein